MQNQTSVLFKTMLNIELRNKLLIDNEGEPIPTVEILQHYKNQGERVDELLYQTVKAELDELRLVLEQKNRDYDLVCEHELKLVQENKRLHEAVSYYADTKHYEPYGFNDAACDVTEDEGYIARQALEQK